MTEALGTLLGLIILYALYLVEAVAVLLCVRFAFRGPKIGDARFRQIESALGRFARKRRLAVVVVGFLTLATRAALLPVLPIREPMITDEYSYLLAAQTFASGRLANPTHPMWIHFETMHVNQKPTYMSMYPPAQGMVLAAGKILFGHPWWGVWLSTGLMCSALCWMLQAWLPPYWAFLGALLAVMRIGLISYWANSYWGGSVAAIGGALVLGALPRILRRQRIWDSLWLALGAAILANSRPYEGLLLCLPAAGALLVWICSRKRPAVGPLLRVVLPAGLVLAVSGVAVGYYNYRLTGNALRMPYQVNRDTYVKARYFIWDAAKPAPLYHHQSLRDYYITWQSQTAEAAMSIFGFLRNGLKNAGLFWLFYVGPVFTLPLVTLPRVLLDKRMRFLVITGGVFLLGLTLDLWFLAHYAAPATCVLYAILVQSLRHLRFCSRRNAAIGRTLARGVFVICAAMLAVRLAAQPLEYYMPPEHPATWFHAHPGNINRARIVERLRRLGSRHLILVRYGPDHDWFAEWVYNEADIDKAPVVWAHEMDEKMNRQLVQYFRDRHVWLLEADLKPPRLSPYSTTTTPNAGLR